MGCREQGWSKRVLFSNDRNAVGYVTGILILSWTAQGCRGLCVRCLVRRPPRLACGATQLDPERGREVPAAAGGGGGLAGPGLREACSAAPVPPLSPARCSLTCGADGQRRGCPPPVTVYREQGWESLRARGLPHCPSLAGVGRGRRGLGSRVGRGRSQAPSRGAEVASSPLLPPSSGSAGSAPTEAGPPRCAV